MRLDVKRWSMVLSAVGLFAALAGASVGAEAIPPFPAARANSAQDQAPPQGGPDERRLPLFGKITAIHDNSMDVLDTNGATISVKFNGQTQFRKDRQPAKRTDFKVGDIILVRGQEAADHSWTAEVVAARSLNGQGGPGGPGGRGGFGGGPGGAGGRGGAGQQAGTLGKDYVSGEIKSVDAPKLTVLRSDNVTQTLELNEETSMRKGRDSGGSPLRGPGDGLEQRHQRQLGHGRGLVGWRAQRQQQRVHHRDRQRLHGHDQLDRDDPEL